MTSVVSAPATRPVIVDRDGDVFHDPGIWLVMILLALLTAVSLIGLALIYYGDSVAVPSWNERAVPIVTTS
jgi:hypothetical protein